MDDQSTRWWDLSAAFFLLVAILTAATRLYATVWTAHLERIQYLALLGALFGLALGQSKFSPRVVKLFALAYGLFFIPWQIGSTMAQGISWNDRLVSVGGRLSVTIWQLFHRQAITDPVLFLTLMGILFWSLSLTAGYYSVRYGNAWMAFLPSGVTLFIINHYDPALAAWATYLGVFLFFGLLYLGRMTYLHYRHEWRRSGVMLPSELGGDIARALVGVVVVLSLLAWNVPALAASISPASSLWVQATQPWNSLRQRFSDVFASLRSSAGAVTDFYGNSLSLGTGTLLGDGVVFTVKASEPPPTGTQYYWRARSYDVYSNGQWSSSFTDQKKLIPGSSALPYPQWSDQHQVNFTFDSRVSLLSTMYSPPLPTSINYPVSAVINPAPDGTVDLSMLVASPPIRAGEVYSVNSLIASPTVSELQASDTNYPDWVRASYLEIPSDLPANIPALARQVTNGLSNPYDKADAITNYLRTNIQYASIIPNPPRNEDPLEWFLFQEKQGFCNYYASAEVVLLRSVGIPARLVVGFAQGEYDVQTGTYSVRVKDGHSWPEVYFSGVGWVVFEPTVSQPAIQLPSGGNSTDSQTLPNSAGRLDQLNQGAFASRSKDNPGDLSTPATPQAIVSRYAWAIALAAVLLLLVAAWFLMRGRVGARPLPLLIETNLEKRGVASPRWLKRWSRRVARTPLQKAFGALNQALWLLGQRPGLALTPAERVGLFVGLLPEGQAAAETLLEEYQRSQYSPYPGDLERSRQAGKHIRRLAYKAFLLRLLTRRPARRPEYMRQS